jgi:predicted DNA-binding transcriptional regulator YafY
MSRTSRLFKLMDALRGHRRPVTAAHLAEELSVSVRTVYRDVRTLIGLGAPIEGEAGIGYLKLVRDWRREINVPEQR